MSPVVSRPLPSAGHSVVVSGYSLPHFGHFFIGRLCLVLSCLGELSAYHTVSLVPKALRSETKMRAKHHATPASLITCLLYTSDAADERSSVDLGGRRII